MKRIRSVLTKGFAGTAQGIKRLAIGVAATGLLLTLAPVSARAESVTQLEALKWLVQLSGESSQFSANATAADFVQWARVKGMAPAGGWQPGTALSSEALAQILVQYFRIAPSKRASDYIRILEREGIIIPTSDEISRSQLVAIFGRQFVIRNNFQNDHNKNDNPAHGFDKDGDDDDDNGKGDGKGKGSPHKPPGTRPPPHPPHPPHP